MKPIDPVWQAKFEALLQEAGVTDDLDIAADMMHAVVRLAHDHPGRGDLKLLTRSFKELRYALKVFKPYRGQRKMSVFGSARTPRNHPDYQAAVKFSELAAQAGFMVITGAGGGIMAAGHEGAGKAKSFGVAIKLPFEQRTNDFIEGDEKLIHFRYFFSRKLIFVKESHAIALFPGGFGTHDEGFEVLTLVQTGRCDPLPIVMMEAPGGTYWKTWDDFVRRELLAKELISEEDTALYFITQDPQAAVDHVVRFYRNYHSLRYFQDDLYLRIKQLPTATELEALRAEFKDIVTEGTLRTYASGEMVGDTEIMRDLPRLGLKFNRRSLARLRMLIDRLNSLPSLPPLGGEVPPASQVGSTKSDRGVGEIAAEESIQLT